MRAMAAEAEAARDARAKVVIMTTKMMMIMMMTTTKMMVIMMMTTTKMMVMMTMMLNLFVQVIAAEGEHKASR